MQKLLKRLAKTPVSRIPGLVVNDIIKKYDMLKQETCFLDNGFDLQKISKMPGIRQDQLPRFRTRK